MRECNFTELSENDLCMISGGLDNHDVGKAEVIVGAIGIGSVGIVIGVVASVAAPIVVGIGSTVLVADGLRRCSN